MSITKSYLLLFFLSILIIGCQNNNASSNVSEEDDASLDKVKNTNILYWGADVVGGIPYVFEDPNNPGSYIGFEMDIARAIARHLGVEQKMVIKPWDNLIPELQRGSFDMAMNGIEDTEDRGKIVSFSAPYFVYSQQITVRKDTQGIQSLEDLKGKKVATLSGTAAEDILRSIPEIQVRAISEIIYCYEDLEYGKVDAVLLDTPIAAAYGATNPKLKNVGKTFAQGNYVIAFRNDQKALRDAIDEILNKMKENGELKAIYTKWGIMDSHQQSIGIE